MRRLAYLGVATMFSAALCYGGEARVELFSPQGAAKAVRQATARFSEPMTTFGDPRNDAPFDISCTEKGSGRWADVKNWVYDFDRDLPAGAACSFTVKPGLKTLSGSPVEGEKVFSFTTGGPALVDSLPMEGQTVSEDQIFVLTLDGEADEASVAAHARFSIQGIAEPVGVEIVKGAQRKEVLKAAHRPDDAKTLAIRCRQHFPAKAAIKLIWGAGTASVSGVKTEQDQVVTFDVRDDFTVSFDCERLKVNSACVPMSPMVLRFSAPVPADTARAIVMKSGKKLYRAEIPNNDEEGEAPAGAEETVAGVVFKGPFPEKRSFSIELPKGLIDDAGRAPANRNKFPLQVKTDVFPPLAKFAAPFGIVELSGDAAVPVTLRNVEARVKARHLDPNEPPKITRESPKAAPEKPKGRIEALTDKARAVGEKVSSWFSGTAKKEGNAATAQAKPNTIRVKQQVLPVEREEKIIEWLRRVRDVRRNKPLLKGERAEEFTIPKPNGDKAFEVVGIPIRKPGFHVIELESPTLGAALLEKPRPMYVSSAALVTNMSAHFKWGRESSLVWVTTLDKGEPVADAEVRVRDCRGKLHWQGKTDASGIARIKGSLPENPPYCRDSEGNSALDDDYYSDNNQHMLSGLSGGLFVFARKRDDLTFVHSSWDRGIENWRFNLPGDDTKERTVAHTVFDRTLLRAGETVHMKHFIRTHTMKGLDLRRAAELPKSVVVEHRGSSQRYQFPLKWAADGSAETSMTLPKGAELGYYDVVLARNAPGKAQKRKTAGAYQEGDEEHSPSDGWNSGFFRVEEFRVPLMKGIVEPPKEPAINATSVDVDLLVSHLSGGGAGGAAVKLRSQIRPRSVTFSDYEDFTFANGKVETGVVKEEPAARDFEDSEPGPGQEAAARQPAYRRQELVLDLSGSARATIADLPRSAAPQTLLAELEFKDPNGEIQTVTGRVPLWPSSLLVGINPDSWLSSTDPITFQTVVLDLKGRPVQGAKVEVEMFSRQHYAHRKRLVGGFYSYENVTETKAVGPVCTGSTDQRGLLRCSATSPAAGNVILQATVTDASGNVSSSHRDVWVAGREEWWFEAGDSDRIDLIAEKKGYEPGQVAKFQVRSPFRSATVLVTVEREGISDAFVTKISGKEPVISVPIKGNYAPNVFVSALCVRGRVAGTQPSALFDPGKPAYRLGISEIRVDRKAHELKVQVSSDSDSYKVRGKARIRIKVTGPEGALPKGAELALAAVDEGLLELMPNDSWKLLDAMTGRRGHEIRTSTAQTQVVGRRHFGLKALPAGGGGGMRSARELFDTLLAWKGRVKLDADGEASVDIPLNDSLTSFSVVAVASAGTGLFGTGRTTIRTTQDLMVLSGLPPLVRQGDRFLARFTVRNASNRRMSVTATATPQWSDAAGFAPLTLTLAPGEAQDVTWPATAPRGVDTATWQVRVQEENGAGADTIKVSQRVLSAVPIRVYQSTIAQFDKALELEVQQPEDALKGRGGIELGLRPRLTEGLGGVTHYMRNYPYTCMEQKVSRAIALKDDALWRQVVSTLPSHLDKDGLVKYFPSHWLEGSPTLTAYILSISDEAGKKLPGDAVLRMEKGLTAFVEGRIRREGSLRSADLYLRKLAAIEALSRRGKATAKLLSSVSIEPNLWPTSAVLDWAGILKRTGDIPERNKRLKEAEGIIRSRLNFQGTVMGFSTEKVDRLWWLMVSTDSNALRTLLTYLDDKEWRVDMPRLVRGALARQYYGRWETTTANAWGVVALDKFSRKFEAAAVTGSTRAELAGAAKSVEWAADRKGKTLSFPWPQGKEKLELRHAGSGKPWVSVTSLAAIPLKEPLSSGYRIRRTVTAVEQKVKQKWSRGDVAKVRLEIEAQSDMTWVAVNDPVPAGATILGSGLGRDSALLNQGSQDRAWPVYEERAHDAYRAYYDYLPKGKLVAEYTVRFNNEGNFQLPPTRVEALYAPELFGEAPNPAVAVEE